MAKGLIDEAILRDIADAIREKTSNPISIRPGEMAGLIRGITTGGGSDIDENPSFIKVISNVNIESTCRPPRNITTIVSNIGDIEVLAQEKTEV